TVVPRRRNHPSRLAPAGKIGPSGSVTYFGQLAGYARLIGTIRTMRRSFPEEIAVGSASENLARSGQTWDRMPRLVFLNRYFAAADPHTSRMVSSLAFALADRGWNVHAVASQQLYGAPHAGLPAGEKIRGVSIHRIRTSNFGRRHIPGRV